MKDEHLYKITGTLGPFLVKALGGTLRIKRYGVENLEEVQKQASFLYAIHHGRMFVPVYYHRNTNIYSLISQSRDGEAVTRLIHGLGYKTVRGSSSQGASSALREIVKTLKAGNNTAILVDGPRGPFGEPKKGIIAMAKMAGVSILPTMGAAKKAKVFNSWDKSQLPLPFSSAVIVYGEPIHVPKSVKGEEMEEYRLKLKQELYNIRDRADSIILEK